MGTHRAQHQMHGIVKTGLWTTLLVLAGGVLPAEGRPAPSAPTPPATPPAQRGYLPLPTTANDFFQPGQQPEPMTPEGDPYQQMLSSIYNCANCHKVDDDQNEEYVVGPFNTWTTSMMAHSARDVIWQAALAISNTEATMSGEYCIRCHAPQSWAAGLSSSGDLSNFTDPEHFDGVSCHFCHRAVDPIADTVNPIEDTDILQALVYAGTYPDDPGNGRFIFDPEDTRRGPEDDWSVNMHGAPILVSPHHNESTVCASCHDLRNPILSQNTDGSYEPNAHDNAHPTQNPHDMMPEQLTYSEWLNSDFANGGVTFTDGRFGGEHPTGTMQSCQDCHMPKHSGASCVFWYVEGVGTSTDVPDHAFVGANTWVIRSVHDMWDPNVTGLNEEDLDRVSAQTESFLQAASDMDLVEVEDELSVTITNWAGHKLPTGFPEGRRMWLNVRFFDVDGNMVLEHGSYDFETGDSDLDDTKVYEMKLGLDATMAAQTGLAEGETKSLILANTILKDNRIPPAGFTNAAYESFDAAPVDYTYPDLHHWDETIYDLPSKAIAAHVTLYYQTTSKEYIEYLRDNSPPNEEGEPTIGQIAYDQWVMHGRSAPVAMDSQVIYFVETKITGDANGDGTVGVGDLLIVIQDWGLCVVCDGDLNGDGWADVNDLLLVIANWG